jgi:hypothetical protein
MDKDFSKILMWFAYATLIAVGVNFALSLIGVIVPILGMIVTVLGFFAALALLYGIKGLKFTKPWDPIIWFGLLALIAFIYNIWGSNPIMVGLSGFMLSFGAGLLLGDIISLLRMLKK